MPTTDWTVRLAQLHRDPPTTEELVELLTTTESTLTESLFAAADEKREQHHGPGVYLRALVEFSNHCTRTCEYCGLRAANQDVQRYRLTPEEILAAARLSEQLGYRTVVLQSGEDPWFTRDIVSDLTRRIKSEGDVALTLCLGERPEGDYAVWRAAGADRYLLRIETSNRELYETLHPGMSYDHRVECLQVLRELGYQVGSGILVGLPGQTPRLLAEDLLFLQRLQPDMVGLGPFIPHPDTPLGGCAPGTVDMVLRVLALARLLLPDCYLVATTALGSIDPQGREKGLQAGANVLMPNATPQRVRADYAIYPNKICLDEEPQHCRVCIERRLESVGRSVATGYGHARRQGED
jgi:biotin synthase